MDPRDFLAELKRRNVYKVAVAYAVVGWLVMQVTATSVPALHLSGAITSAVVLLTLLGFPIAVVLAWAFELTPDGIKRTDEVAPDRSFGRQTSRKLTFLLIAVLLLATGVLVLRHYTPPQTTATPTAQPPEKSIAVLPFENLSADQENGFFTDGVQDEILTDLARIADLKVISRTSVMQYKSGAPRNLRQIAEELGVAQILEGSVQRSANKVRVNAQLIDVRTDAHLWAHTYDRDLADVFAIQSEIAEAIADQLQAKLSPNERVAIERPQTTDLTAFDLYSRAKTLTYTTRFSATSREMLKEAADLLNQAVARDPSFFEAYCLLAYTRVQVYFLGFDHTPEQLTLAEDAVNQAIRLQPNAGETHLARAEFLYRAHLDFGNALAELEIARQTLPNDPRVPELTGYIVRRQGRFDQALQNLNRTMELDPRNFFVLQQIALSNYMLRRYGETAAVLDRALAIRPDDADAIVYRALVEFDWKADTRPLLRAIESIRANNPAALPRVADSWLLGAMAERDAAAAQAALEVPGAGVFGYDAVQFHRSFGHGLIALITNESEKARAAFTAARAEQAKLVEAQPEYGPTLAVLGIIDASLGRKEEALREGRRAIELMPLAKDSINGAHMIECLAIIAAWAGEKDLACEQLERVLQIKSLGPTTYGQLKKHPFWDPLRGYPRFEKIVASLAPKEPPSL